MNTSRVLGAIVVALIQSAGSSAFAQTVLVERDISAQAAFRMAQAAMAACKANQFDVSVVVLDRVGNVRLGVRADAARPHNYELARRKAYTALTFRRPSAEWARTLKDRPDLAGQVNLADVIALGGGIPIISKDETIGAIGVSGSTVQNGDEACASAGLAAVAADLK